MGWFVGVKKGSVLVKRAYVKTRAISHETVKGNRGGDMAVTLSR